MERVIDCPICYNSDSCFEDIQDKFKSYMCFNCGFMSNSMYTKDNLDKVEKDTSQLVNDIKFLDDERNVYWYPAVVNMGAKGIIFPEGNVEDWVWKYAKVIAVPEEFQSQYPIPGKDGEFYAERLDVENAKTYGQYEFMDACKDMGITMEVPNA